MRFIKFPRVGKMTGPGKLLAPILALSLTTIATAIYLSPVSGQAAPGAFTVTIAKHGQSSSHVDPSSPSSASSASSSSSASSASSSSSSSGKPDKVLIVRTMAPDVIHVTSTATQVMHSVQTVVPEVKPEYCSQFRWQQDAQAAYLANLSDPWGLDGAVGPNNGDGLACTGLPTDPNRPGSTPADAYVAPPPADKSALVQPATDYYGLSEDSLPGDTPRLTTLDQAAGKAPSALEWFSTFSAGYDVAKVRASWAVGALPIITWMSEDTAPDTTNYSLANIVSGQFDTYLQRYAGDIRATGLPVVIRFDHEMNGNWYPWSAGNPANKGANGQPNLYVQAWRHIWNVFNSVGANQDVIWLWSLERVDTMKPDLTTGGSKYETSPAEDYPGDQYVDWVGMSAYEYKPSEPWTFSDTFAKTLAALKVQTTKPIFIAETGASETAGTQDVATQKAAWTTSALSGFLADPSIVGFVWFNNDNDVHVVDGATVNTDWQFTTSPEAQAAFVAGIDDPGYSSGLMPDGG